MLYKKSDGKEIEIRDMPTPYLNNAIQKARREKNPILEHLEEELRLREQPVWKILTTTTPVRVYKELLTNAEAWSIVKEMDQPSLFQVAVMPQSDAL